jgi:beta-glucosidase
MTSYNVVNGIHADMNHRLIRSILRGEWGFKGLVMSDWGGTNSVVDSVLAGLDLEMPGPPEKRGKKLLQAFMDRNTSDLRSAIDESVVRILSLAEQQGLLGLSEEEAAQTRTGKEYSSTNEENVKLMRSTAAKGIVLLKNDLSVLPLKPETLQGKQVAFIGPNALTGTPGGGGSASMNPQYLSQPMDSFKATALAQGIELKVVHSLGSNSKKWLPLLARDQWRARESTDDSSDKTLIRLDFYASIDFTGPVVETQYRNSSDIDLLDTVPLPLRQDPVLPYSFRVTSTLRPRTTGSHSFSVSSVGNARIFIDDELVVDNSVWTELGETFYAFGSVEKRGSKHMNATQTYKIMVEGWTRSSASSGEPTHVFAAHPSLRIGYQEQLLDNMIADAVKLANESDYCIVVLGLDSDWESEGYDRQSMALPGDQDDLAQALLTQSEHPERLIFVNQSGSPVELPWAVEARTMLQTWYGGQEAGNAITDVLLGTVNPSGRLPITWPKKYADLPFEADKEMWPGVQGKVYYKEEVDVGYRYYLNHNIEPQFWFGYGLSYSKFTSSISEVTDAEDNWSMLVTVTNEGIYAGENVVQLYAWPVERKEQRTLVAFEKTELLHPQQNVSLVLVIRKRELASWIDDKWLLSQGDYMLGIGENVGVGNMLTTEVKVETTRTWLASEY